MSSAISSVFPTVYADGDDGEGGDEEGGSGEGGEDGGDEGGEEGGDEGGEEGGDEEGGDEEEEEEEDEPEDLQPAIYEDCENSKECAPAKHHFLECQERVESGNGFKDESCVEEL